MRYSFVAVDIHLLAGILIAKNKPLKVYEC